VASSPRGNTFLPLVGELTDPFLPGELTADFLPGELTESFLPGELTDPFLAGELIEVLREAEERALDKEAASELFLLGELAALGFELGVLSLTSNRSASCMVLLIRERKDRRVPTLCFALVHATDMANTLGGSTA
jgi:hypothetical protein